MILTVDFNFFKFGEPSLPNLDFSHQSFRIFFLLGKSFSPPESAMGEFFHTTRRWVLCQVFTSRFPLQFANSLQVGVRRRFSSIPGPLLLPSAVFLLDGFLPSTPH